MSELIIPIIILIILFYGIYKKQNIYNQFLDGAKEGLIMIYKIIPTMLAMIFAINILLKCGIINYFLRGINNNIFPIEIIPMVLLRPISGNATLAIMCNIFKIYGPDSYLGLLASTIQGCTDTTLYVIALYFGSVRIIKSRYAIGVGLFADLIGIIASVIIVSIFFG